VERVSTGIKNWMGYRKEVIPLEASFLLLEEASSFDVKRLLAYTLFRYNDGFAHRRDSVLR